MHLRRLRATAPLKLIREEHATLAHGESPSPPGDGPIEAARTNRPVERPQRDLRRLRATAPLKLRRMLRCHAQLLDLRRLRATAPLKRHVQHDLAAVRARISVASGRWPH